MIAAFTLFLLTSFSALAAEPPACHDTTEAVSAEPVNLIGGDYELTNAKTGSTVTPKDLEGKLQLVFFGFTHCQTICPIGMQTMARTLDALGDDAKDLTPVFITTDPARDTAPVVATYVANFGPSVVGLVGDEDAVKTAMNSFRVEAQKMAIASDKVYQMDHPAIFFFMDRDGKLIDIVPSNSDPAALAETIRAKI